MKAPVFSPVFLQISVNPWNLLHLINCKLYWYKHIQMCVNVWNSVNDTHNQGVDGSSTSGPTDNQGVTMSKL